MTDEVAPTELLPLVAVAFAKFDVVAVLVVIGVLAVIGVLVVTNMLVIGSAVVETCNSPLAIRHNLGI